MRIASETSRRVLLSRQPSFSEIAETTWNTRGEWPAHWISCEGSERRPLVAAYRLNFDLSEAQPVRLHVTADERYRLYLNGNLIGSGSERGDVEHWYFESYEVTMPVGRNTLVAQVWSLGADAAFAQMSLRHGFLLCPDQPELCELFATGVADWESKELSGYRFVNPQTAWGTGFNITIDGAAFSWGFQKGGGEGWTDAVVGDKAVFPEGNNDKPRRHLLRPAVLPAMADALWSKARVRHVSFPAPGPTAAVPFRPEENLDEELIDWTRLVIGTPFTVPANTRRRVLLDLHDYVCAYPELVVSKGRGSQVRINWQEALFEAYGAPEKGNRDQIENKYFCTMYGWEDGVGDTFVADGGDRREFTTLWWQSGRYVELLIQTEAEPLVLESIRFKEDRYPLENRLQFSSSDSRLAQVGELAFRTLQMCSHETYMDCPYYEQLQYIGDTRLQALATYVTGRDDRLPRKALQMFDWSRQIDGITQSRYPSRVTQIIPPFSLWWVCMISDFATWRDDKAFVASLLPGARAVLDWFRATRTDLGLVSGPRGWNFVDWTPGWSHGMPVGADQGASSIINRQFEMALRCMAQIEHWMGEEEMAARHLQTATEIADGVHRAFWNHKRGMYADDLAHSSFSEHAQVLSILTDALPPKIERLVLQGLITERDLHRTTVYFTHYLFEAYARAGRTDLILNRMDLWFGHLTNGLKTIIEHPEPTRSDCHAWGSHPLYHYVASILGIRPVGFGAKNFAVAPNLGGLTFAKASFPLAGGQISIEVTETAVQLSLPPNTSADLLWRGQTSRHVGASVQA